MEHESIAPFCSSSFNGFSSASRTRTRRSSHDGAASGPSPRRAREASPGPRPPAGPESKRRAVPEAPTSSPGRASLVGDLARRSASQADSGSPVEIRVHDRTHFEFAIDYPIDPKPRVHTWEAFFFVPESFRLHEDTYEKKAIYDDLCSYVRYAVPSVPLGDLASEDAGTSLGRVSASLDACVGKGNESPEAREAMRELRLFACLVRTSGLAALREVARELTPEGPPHASVRALAASFAASADAVGRSLRGALERSAGAALPEDVRIAVRWMDEDVSLVLETLSATLSAALEDRSLAGSPLLEVAEQTAALAVREARHRRARGDTSVGSAGASPRDVEHLEFRRHILKRFSASVLWLSMEVRRAESWRIHALYAIAAATAMTCAVTATFRSKAATDDFFRYAFLAVLGYVVKDRVKVFLQRFVARVIDRRFPDRRWSIKDRERGFTIGEVHERAAFLPFASLPSAVLMTRRMTRAHPLEERARPERVLWHQKTVHVAAPLAGDGADPFPMLTEIFRLNLDRWLSHTDDPSRKVVFADPSDARIYASTARRVYNINVVYRLQTDGAAESPWHRLRVVVSRKGIERIEAVC